MKRYICQDCGHQILTAQKPSACEVCEGTILLPFEGKKNATTRSGRSKSTTMIDVSGFGVKKEINRPSTNSPPPLPPPPPPLPKTQSQSRSSPPKAPPSSSSQRKSSRYNPGSLDSNMMNITSKPSVHLDSSMLSSYHQPVQAYKQRQRRPKKPLPLKNILLGGLGVLLLGLGGFFINYRWIPFFNTNRFQKVILNENFTAPKKWSLTNGAKIKDGGLFHRQPHVKHYGKSIWTGYKFINVDFSADVNKVGGPDNVPYGLITRLGGKNYDDFYYLFISGNGTWIMGKHSQGSWEKQGKWHKNKVINKGNKGTNRLRIVAKGDLIIGYINGKRVGHFRDKSFQSGRIAVTSFRGTGEPVAVYFDNVVAKIENK